MRHLGLASLENASNIRASVDSGQTFKSPWETHRTLDMVGKRLETTGFR
jgi:hypothetical protein